jgi:hypothetical protein
MFRSKAAITWDELAEYPEHPKRDEVRSARVERLVPRKEEAGPAHLIVATCVGTALRERVSGVVPVMPRRRRAHGKSLLNGGTYHAMGM